MRIDEATGRPLLLFNQSVPVNPGSPEKQAKEYLRNYGGVLGLSNPNLDDLQTRHVREGLGSATVRFDQFFKGVPVYKGELVLNISENNKVTYVINDYKAIAANFDVTPGLSASAARNIAHTYMNVQGVLQLDAVNLVVQHHAGVSRLAYQVRVVPDSPMGDWDVLVDALTGDIFKCADLACYCHPKEGDSGKGKGGKKNKGAQRQGKGKDCASGTALVPVNGTGMVWDGDPLSSAGVPYGGNYVDNNDATNAQLDAERFTYTLQDIDLTSGTYTLRGPYAEIQDFENPNRGLFQQASPNFLFNRQQNNFEAVNVYYHIDQSMRYINLTLGISLMPYQYATGVRFDPSGLNGADNSHYLGGTGRLAFGDGGVDDAECVDVVLHELGHGLHDWVTNGGLSQVNGLSEGSGDYWAQSYARSLGHRVPAEPEYQWVFKWDGHNPFWNGRVTNYGAAYPGGLVGQIHTDGQIWSTCLMLIYDAIGRTKTDMAFLEGLALTNGGSSQQDAAIAVRQAGINMNYSIARSQCDQQYLPGLWLHHAAFPGTVQLPARRAQKLQGCPAELGNCI